MGALLVRIKDWWQGADRTQRLVSVFGSLFLVVLIGLTAFFASKPKMQPVYAGLNPADQGMVVEELRKRGIPVEIGPSGAVLVPSTRVDEVPMVLATAGKMPISGDKGSAWLDNMNWLGTPAQEREKIKAGKESELARSIMTLDGIESALVHINFGKDSEFMDETVAPTAVVNIKESGRGSVRPEQAKAIARLIQNSVPGLGPEGVSVINSSGRLVYDGQEQNSAEGLANKKLETETAEAKHREADLQKRLDLAFGPGNTVAMVQLELNMDAVSQDMTERKLGDKKVTGEATETLNDANGAGAIGGATGIDANTPGAPATAGTPGGKVAYQSSTKSMDYPSIETHTSTKKAAGELTSLTVSVIANKTAIKDPSAIQSILDDYLGAKKGQPGFTASVQAVEFDTTAQTAEKKAAASAASAAQMQQLVSLMPIVALLIVGFMVAKAIGRIPGRTLTMALPNGGSMTVPASTAELVGHSAGSLESAVQGVLPERMFTSVQQLAQTEPELAEALSAMGIDHIDDTVDVEAIRQRIDLPLEQIKKMARQKPQAVAMLLKSWLMEERR